MGNTSDSLTFLEMQNRNAKYETIYFFFLINVQINYTNLEKGDLVNEIKEISRCFS